MRVSFVDFSDDETRAIIFVSSSNDIGTYYLYDAKKGLLPLGRVRPGLDPAQIATTELVSYKARDGLTIPAFLTIPKRGAKPFPLVVMPHGGPWARDDLDFDTWRQFLADRGYVVLQPQYRGSEGWGQTLWRAGDREWGQKMQDDKDDGARWLVTQGLVDPNRMAIYGFSYGGYAAMASIVRPNPPWQCAIAGAGLAELRTFDKITFEGRFGREFQNPTIAGLSPIDHVEQASIPIMIFHGNRDQIVPIEQSERYFAALKRAGKNVQYTEIGDYGHGPSLSTAQQAQVLQILENYLSKDCGPGGL
jgi:dipeptidyl aminopeptidase/acylaminoacyl peptidase